LNTFGSHSKTQHQEWDPAMFSGPQF